MRNCPSCTAENTDMATFCKGCGITLPKIEKSQSELIDMSLGIMPESVNSNTVGSNSLAEKLFVSPTETIMATIGNSYLENFISGNTLGKNIAILTDKRLYYKGVALVENGVVRNEEGCVPVDDITYTKFTTTSNYRLMGSGLLCIILFSVIAFSASSILGDSNDFAKFASIIGVSGIFLGLLMIGVALMSQKTVFFISFAGGFFSFDVSSYSMSEFRSFQRRLHLLKDKIKVK